jgi:choline transport protein
VELTLSSQVHSRTSIPFAAILTTCIISLLLLLIYLGSPLVLSDMISLSLNSFYGSYFISAAILLYRRLMGQIKERSAENDCAASSHLSDNVATTIIVGGIQSGEHQPPIDLTWGPWRVRGWPGTLNNSFACAWMLLVLFFSSWPTVKDVNSSSMNYSVLITVFVALSSVIYYLVWARRSGGYIGPVIETRI